MSRAASAGLPLPNFGDGARRSWTLPVPPFPDETPSRRPRPKAGTVCTQCTTLVTNETEPVQRLFEGGCLVEGLDA